MHRRREEEAVDRGEEAVEEVEEEEEVVVAAESRGPPRQHGRLASARPTLDDRAMAIMVAPSGDYLAPPLIGRFFGS